MDEYSVQVLPSIADLPASVQPASPDYHVTAASGTHLQCYVHTPNKRAQANASTPGAAQPAATPSAFQSLPTVTPAPATASAAEWRIPAGVSGQPGSQAEAVEQAVRAAIGRQCLYEHVGYWTYELCPFDRVRQMHFDQAASHASQPAALPENHPAPAFEQKLPSAVQVLGVWAPAASTLQAASPNTRALHQSYLQGDANRNVQVRYVCGGDPSLPPQARQSDVAGVTRIVSISEHPTLHYTVIVSVADSTVCELLGAHVPAVHQLNGTCMHRQDGWWTYTLCIGRHLKQYHDEDGTRVADHLLGVYDWQYGEVLDVPEHGSIVSATLDPLLPSDLHVSTSPITAGEAAKPALVQMYTQGSSCDMTGEARQAEVRLTCNKQAHAQLQSVREVRTCQYEAVVASWLACKQPALAALQPDMAKESHQVLCVPVPISADATLAAEATPSPSPSSSPDAGTAEVEAHGTLSST